MSFVLGIDFGTSTTRAAVVRENRVDIVRDLQGNSGIPSYVAFTNAKRLFAEDATKQMALDPGNSIYDVKRLIGRYFNDSAVASDRKFWAFRVGRSFDRGLPRMNVKYHTERRFFAIEVAAMLMRQMKLNAEEMLKEPVRDIVISVPACFNSIQRKAMEDAAQIAGLTVKRTLNEPTAVAIAHFNRKRMPVKPEFVMVVDVGGGCFDVSILSVGNQMVVVRSTAGDNHCGGVDVDNLLTAHFVDRIKEVHQVDLFDRSRTRSLFLLRRECERAKIRLSSSGVMTTNLEFKCPTDDFEFRAELSRDKLEELCVEWFAKIEKGMRSALRGAQIDGDLIDRVLLSGGSTHIPKLQRLLSRVLGGRTVEVWQNDKAVVNGCALVGKKGPYWRSHNIDVWPFGYEVDCQDGTRAPPLVEPFRPIPCSIVTMLPASVDCRPLELREVSANGHETPISMSLGRLQLLESQWIRLTITIDVDGIVDVQADAEGDVASDTNPVVMYDEIHSPAAVRKMIQEAKKDSKWDAGAEGRAAIRLVNETSTAESSEDRGLSSTSSEDEYFDEVVASREAAKERRDPDYVPHLSTSRKRKLGTNPMSSDETDS